MEAFLIHNPNGNIELIKEYYKVNDIKAKTILTLLSEQQIDHIKTKLSKGGVK